MSESAPGSPSGSTLPGAKKPPVNVPLVVLFSLLMCCALPILPIYLWRMGRLSAPWGIGLAFGWLALFVAIGAAGSQLPEDVVSKPAAGPTKAAPKPKPTKVTPTKATPAEVAPTKATPTAKPKPCADIAKNVLKNPSYVFKCQFGKAWPLTVDQGLVGCRDKPGTGLQILTFFDPDGKEWALNGTALSAKYPAIDPIWKDDDFAGKVDIGPLIDRAAKVCE